MHLPLSFRIVGREGLASLIGNLAGEPLLQAEAIDVADMSIPKSGALVGRFGVHTTGSLPEVIVVRDEDLEDTYAWISAYFNGLTPISQWCRIWRQSEFARLDFVSKEDLGVRTGAWIGAVIGECLVQANYRLSLKEMPGSAALATATFAAARGTAVWGDLLDLDDLGRRYDALQHRLSAHSRPLSSRDFLPLWYVLSENPTVSRNVVHQKSLTRLSVLFEQIATGGIEALKQIAVATGREFDLLELAECAHGSQPQRVDAVDRLAKNLSRDPASSVRDALLGFGASLVDPGVAALPDLLRRHTGPMPMAPLWLGAFAGAWSSAKVINDNQGLGRMVLKALEQSADFGSRPVADIAFDELNRWLGPQGGKRPSIRAMSSRNLNVEILPGVVTPFGVSGESQESAVPVRQTSAVQPRYQTARQAPREDMSSLERILRVVVQRLDALEAQVSGQPQMLPGLEEPVSKPKAKPRSVRAKP